MKRLADNSVLACVLAISLSGCAGLSAGLPHRPPGPSSLEQHTRRAQASPIDHVVIIVQENRSTDNLFHHLPGADTADSGMNSEGQVIQLQPVALAARYDLEHTHESFVAEYDNGKMDGADLVKCKGHPCPQNPQFVYVNQSDVAPYFEMAQTYTFGDRMFETNQGPSYPAHQYLIAGTSQPSVGSNLLAVDSPERPGGGSGGSAGCTAPSGTLVDMIDQNGNPAPPAYPCFEHPTLMDLLDSAQIKWRYYASGPSSVWTGPNSIRHIRFGNDWRKVIIPETKVLSDISNGTLAPVTWVMPPGLSSDHPGSTDGSGPSWVASIVNGIGNSPYWGKTAIFVLWDDWGGFYEHVPPSDIFNSNEVGLRVPLIVISPYAKPAYVSHVNHEFGSILHFVETNFGLPSLGYSDSRSDDMSDCFNYLQVPLPFHTIQAPLHGDYFRRGVPQAPPDDY
jgi:phospholipase C